jgi:hypothetical protein
VRPRDRKDVEIFRGHASRLQLKGPVAATQTVLLAEVEERQGLEKGRFAAVVGPHQAVRRPEVDLELAEPLEILKAEFPDMHLLGLSKELV